MGSITNSHGLNSAANAAPMIADTEITMSSLDFLNNIINPARVESGERKVRNNDFVARIEDEIDDLGAYEIFVSYGKESKVYQLSIDQMMLIGMRESKAVRRSVLSNLKELKSKLSSTTHQVVIPDFNDPVAAARAWADQLEQRQVLTLENKQQQVQIESLESLFRQGMTIPQFCKMLNGVNVMKVAERLEERNWLYNESRSGNSKRWRVASYARDRYLTEEQQQIGIHGYESFIKFTPVLLQAGAVRLYQLYVKNELPMKKDWDGTFTQDKVIKGAA